MFGTLKPLRLPVSLEEGCLTARLVHQGCHEEQFLFPNPLCDRRGRPGFPYFLAMASDPLPHTRWTVIFNEVSNGTFGDDAEVAQFIVEERSGTVDQKAQAQTPFKRPKFGWSKFESETDEEVNEQQWAMVEDSFQMAGVSLVEC